MSFLRKRSVSSAYCRLTIPPSCTSGRSPWMRPCPTALINILVKTSATKLKRREIEGHPVRGLYQQQSNYYSIINSHTYRAPSGNSPYPSYASGTITTMKTVLRDCGKATSCGGCGTCPYFSQLEMLFVGVGHASLETHHLASWSAFSISEDQWWSPLDDE